MPDSLYIIMAGVLWGSMGIFVRGLAAYDLTSTEMVTIRSFGSLLFLFVFVLIKDRRLFRIRLKDIWCFAGCGIVSLTFFNFCYFTTIQATSMAVAAILLYTSPIFVVIFSAVLFKEKITLFKIAAMLLAVCGCAFVTLGGANASSNAALSITGIMIGIGAGVGYALYSIFGRFAINKGYQSLTITFYTMLMGTLGASFLAPLWEVITKIVGIMKNNAVAHDTSNSALVLIAYIIGIVIVATILPYLSYTKGLMKVENGKAGIMAAIEPVVAAVLGIIIFKEKLSAVTFAGIALVIAAIVLLNVRTKKTRESNNDC